jgi:hypothetical protein
LQQVGLHLTVVVAQVPVHPPVCRADLLSATQEAGATEGCMQTRHYRGTTTRCSATLQHVLGFFAPYPRPFCAVSPLLLHREPRALASRAPGSLLARVLSGEWQPASPAGRQANGPNTRWGHPMSYDTVSTASSVPVRTSSPSRHAARTART